MCCGVLCCVFSGLEIRDYKTAATWPTIHHSAVAAETSEDSITNYSSVI